MTSSTSPLVLQSAMRERNKSAYDSYVLPTSPLDLKAVVKKRYKLSGYDSRRPPTSHYDAEFRSSSWGSKPSPRSSSTASCRTKFCTRRSRILYTQLGVSISISIPSIDSIICIPKRKEQRTPYQSKLVSLVDIDLEMPSPSIPCWQWSLEMILQRECDSTWQRPSQKLTVGLQIGRRQKG